MKNTKDKTDKKFSRFIFDIDKNLKREFKTMCVKSDLEMRVVLSDLIKSAVKSNDIYKLENPISHSFMVTSNDESIIKE